MISSVLFVGLLMQGPGLDQQPGNIGEVQARMRQRLSLEALAPSLVSRDSEKEVALRRKHFVSSFNQLVDAIQSFANSYNEGATMDLKKIQALKKAWRELESSDEWFKPRKN